MVNDAEHQALHKDFAITSYFDHHHFCVGDDSELLHQAGTLREEVIKLLNAEVHRRGKPYHAQKMQIPHPDCRNLYPLEFRWHTIEHYFVWNENQGVMIDGDPGWYSAPEGINRKRYESDLREIIATTNEQIRRSENP